MSNKDQSQWLKAWKAALPVDLDPMPMKRHEVKEPDPMTQNCKHCGHPKYLHGTQAYNCPAGAITATHQQYKLFQCFAASPSSPKGEQEAEGEQEQTQEELWQEALSKVYWNESRGGNPYEVSKVLAHFFTISRK